MTDLQELRITAEGLRHYADSLIVRDFASRVMELIDAQILKPEPESTAPDDQPHALSSEAAKLRDVLRACVSVGTKTFACDAAYLLALLDAHANDLADMRAHVEQTETLYDTITVGRQSKWNTDVKHIIAAHEEALEKAYAEGKADALDLEWKRERPTEEGAYWVRRFAAYGANAWTETVHRFGASGALMVVRHDGNRDRPVDSLPYDLEWCGPLPKAPPR